MLFQAVARYHFLLFLMSEDTMICIKLDICYCVVNTLPWQFCLKVDTAKF